MSPAGAVPNGNLAYLCVPNWQANVVKYSDFLYNFRFLYPEVALISVGQHVGVRFGNVICCWIPMHWSDKCLIKFCWVKAGLTFPLALADNIKLLYHSDVLYTPIHMMIFL